MFWFETGGRRIGRMSLDITQLPMPPATQESDLTAEQSQQPQTNVFKWKLIGKYNKGEFSPHYILIFVNDIIGYFVLGGQDAACTCLQYTDKTLKIKAPMPQEKTFFAAFYFDGKIYTFGGYDAYDK